MNEPNDDELIREARIFTNYLLHKAPSSAAVELYVRAIRVNPGMLDAREAKLLTFALKHAWLLGCIDGGLVFMRPNAEVRRRIYTMLSILETTPDFAEDFLPRQRSGWYTLAVAWAGVHGALRAALGILIVKAIV